MTPARGDRNGRTDAHATVTYGDAEPSGLGELVGRLIEANLAAHPRRASLLRPATVELRATDAGVAAVIDLGPGSVRVRARGQGDPPDLVVAATSRDLLELTAAPLRLGIPDPVSPRGRAVLGAIARRRLTIAGAIRHPLVLSRFARLVSVADDGRS